MMGSVCVFLCMAVLLVCTCMLYLSVETCACSERVCGDLETNHLYFFCFFDIFAGGSNMGTGARAINWLFSLFLFSFHNFPSLLLFCVFFFLQSRLTLLPLFFVLLDWLRIGMVLRKNARG
jgi:hypothetical protein